MMLMRSVTELDNETEFIIVKSRLRNSEDLDMKERKK